MSDTTRTPGPKDPSRFAGTAEDIVPLTMKSVISKLTPEQQKTNAAHDEGMAKIRADRTKANAAGEE